MFVPTVTIALDEWNRLKKIEEWVDRQATKDVVLCLKDARSLHTRYITSDEAYHAQKRINNLLEHLKNMGHQV